MKEKYLAPEIEVIMISENIITTSFSEDDVYDFPEEELGDQ